MKRFILSLLALLSATTWALADSPLTSTEWGQKYPDNELRQEIRRCGLTIAGRMYFCLGSDIDGQLALVNYMGWESVSKKRLPLCIKTYREMNNMLNATDDEVLMSMPAKTRSVMAYLMAMDDISDERNIAKARDLALSAWKQEPTSQAVGMVYALLESQMHLENGRWDKIYPTVAKIAYSNKLEHDISPIAISAIMEYIYLYKKHTEEK